MRARRLALALFAVAAGCGRGDDDLWRTRFTAGAAVTRTDVAGTWEGDVAMGGIRLRIEPARLTLALRCDRAGDKVAQGSAPIRLVRATASRIVVEQDLAGGDKDCGFRFNKGDAFDYALTAQGLEIAFAGASASRLAKLADLPAPK